MKFESLRNTIIIGIYYIFRFLYNENFVVSALFIYFWEEIGKLWWKKWKPNVLIENMLRNLLISGYKCGKYHILRVGQKLSSNGI